MVDFFITLPFSTTQYYSVIKKSTTMTMTFQNKTPPLGAKIIVLNIFLQITKKKCKNHHCEQWSPDTHLKWGSPKSQWAQFCLNSCLFISILSGSDSITWKLC